MPSCILAGHPSFTTVYGQGPRKGLLLHCSLAHSGVYTHLGAQLGGALTLTGFDMPGHGRAAPWDGQGDLQDLVTQMAQEMLTDEPMDVIGHSFGGTVALRLAVSYPEKIRTLTLIEPVMMAIATQGRPDLQKTLEDEMRDFNIAFDAGDLEGAAKAFTSRYGDGRPWDTLSKDTRQAITDRIHLIRAGNRAVNEDFHGLLENNLMSRITMPTLVIDGGEGGPMMDGVCDGLLRLLPDASRVRILGGGHMAPLTKPTPVAQEILHLINRVQA